MSKRKLGSDASVCYDLIGKIMNDGSMTVHFIGIGGVSMYSLARLTLTCGARVSGSDREESDRTRELLLLGAKVHIRHKPENVNNVDLVVYSHAISADNCELVSAREQSIPTVSRAEYLGAMMLEYKCRIGISGSHGKSTTVAMLDCIFSYAGSDPTTLSGSDLPIGTPIRKGSKGLMIYEACEYKDSFLRFSPTISVGLNLELDHTDYFDGIDALKNSFTKALGKASRFALINGDDENLTYIKDGINTTVITFGSGEQNDYRYSITSFREVGFEFTLSRYGSVIGSFELNIPGVFNVYNAAAAIIIALEYGIDVTTACEAISRYRGISGRLEFIGKRFGRLVFYDYAHHPTEILASINAIKQLTRQPITLIFKPHTFSRTKALWNEFCEALSAADYLILTDIYPAREEPMEGISSSHLASDIGGTARYYRDDMVLSAIDHSTTGTIVLMGAGNLDKIKKEILTK